MAEPMARTVSTTETAPSSRAVRSLAGKCSRVIPRKATVTAHKARRPPQTWKAFTRRTLLHRHVTRKCHLLPILRADDPLDRQHQSLHAPLSRRPARLLRLRPHDLAAGLLAPGPRRLARAPLVRHLRAAPPPPLRPGSTLWV